MKDQQENPATIPAQGAEYHSTEEGFRALAENSPDYIARYDRECRRLYMNRAILKIEPELAGKIGTQSPPLSLADPALYTDLLRQVLDSGEPRAVKMQFRDAMGELRWGHLRIVPEFAPDGQVTSALAICRDITELKESEAELQRHRERLEELVEERTYALQESEARLRALIDNLPIEFWAMDTDLRYTMQNATSLANYGPVVGKCIDDLGLPQEVAAGWIEQDRLALAGNIIRSPYEKELHGEKRYYEGLIAPVKLKGSVAGIVGVSLDITPRRQAEDRVRQLNAELEERVRERTAELEATNKELRDTYTLLRELSARRETAREEERKRVARDIHDELGQHLTALRMGISSLRLRFGSDLPLLGERIQELVALTDKTIHVVRNVATALRPGVVDAGLAPALEWLVDQFELRTDIPCRLSMPHDPPALGEECATALFRIVQESLTNVIRHADAKRVVIELSLAGGACIVEVRDDGRGFMPSARLSKTFGLLGMRERALMLGGEVTVDSSPGHGTAVRAKIPIDSRYGTS